MEEPRGSPSLTPPPEYIPQPDHFYSSSGVDAGLNVTRNLRPEDDPMATRGIPVFKPSWYEFCDFEKYMEAILPWGMRSGIVKVIPPKEWKHSLPDMKPMLEDIRIRHPIEQNMVGISGLFRQQNIEKRRVYSLREWVELGMSDDFRTPGKEEVQRDLKRGVAGTGRRPRTKKGLAEASIASSSPASFVPTPEDNQTATPNESHYAEDLDHSMDTRDTAPDTSATNSPREASVLVDSGHSPNKQEQQVAGEPSAPIHTAEGANISNDTQTSDLNPDLSLEAGAQNPPLDAAALQKAALARQRKAARAALKNDLDATFINTFDPSTSWLPAGCTEEDYQSPEFVAGLERLYWRSCGVGKAAMYGADLPGSLFTQNVGSSFVASTSGAQFKKHNPTEGPIPWNVSNLPSALTRLLPRGMKIPGVNTPYLYFGMWRATFAWHVEDMDLFSINYIHWGAPKHWYAVPQGRANALEGVMKQFFPSDKNGCPQFLRHKSYLASPTALKSASVKPNILVQQAGEFVITYPRGYHAGFNTGLNCAESVNFALDSWLDLGRKARFCRCVSDSVRIDVDALLAERAQMEADEKAGIRRPQVEPRQAAIRPAHPPQAYAAPQATQRPRKRKLHEIQPPVASQSRQGGFIAYQPNEKSTLDGPPAKRVHHEVDTRRLPCCLCTSTSENELLPVNDPPFPYMGVPAPKTSDGTVLWRAHEVCAMTIPETWVDEVDGQKRVFGVDGIIKDRWNLRCSACPANELKAHGAPIQCAKGKCSKAFHVNCAEQGKGNARYRILEIQESDVLITMEAAATLPTSSTPDSQADPNSLAPASDGTTGAGTHRVLKTIKKYVVEVLCGLHNPAVAQAKRDAKTQKLHEALLAIPEGGRIRVKFATGVYECTLLQVNSADETVLVAWSEGGTKVFNWNKILFEGSRVGLLAQNKPSGSIVQWQLPPAPPPQSEILPSLAKASASSVSSSHPASIPAPLGDNAHPANATNLHTQVPPLST